MDQHLTRLLLLLLSVSCLGQSVLYAQLDCCSATPLNGTSLSVGSVDGPGNVQDQLSAGTCFLPGDTPTGEDDAYFIVFEALSSGTFEMLVTPNNLDADYDFILYEGGCPGSSGTNVISCSYTGPINPGNPQAPLAPTGIANDPQGTYGITPNPTPVWNEWENTVNLVAGNTYLLVLNNITDNGVGFALEVGGSAQLGPSPGIPGNEPDIIPPGPICDNNPLVQLTGNPPGGTWGGDASPTGTFNPQALGPGSVQVTYTAPDANGCPGTTTENFTILSSPAININSPNQFCLSDGEVLLNATPAGGTWSGAVGPSGLFNTQILGTGSFTANYTYTSPNACTATADLTFNISPNPTVNINPPGTICGTTPVQLTASPPGGTWSGAASPSGLVSPATTGPGNFPVTYTYTDPNGCQGQQTINITIQPPTNITFSNTGPFCLDDGTVTVSATPAGGTWSGDAGPGGLINTQALGVGTHTVTYTFVDGGGCVTAQDATIEVLANPVIVINVPPPLCSDSPFQLTASPAGGTWSGAATPGGLINPQNLGPGSFPVTYSVTSPNGCSATQTATITILPPPPIVFNTPGPFCIGQGVVNLSASPFGGSWGGVSLPNGSTVIGALGLGVHTATYTYTDNNGCTNTEALDFEVVPDPEVTITDPGVLCADGSPVTLEGDPAGGTWGGAADGSGTVDPQQLGVGQHLVTYTYTDLNFCTVSDELQLEVNDGPAVSISAPPGPFCSSNPPIALTGEPAGGTWGGDAAPNGTFDPAGRPNGIYTATYTFTDPNGCTGEASIDLEISTDLQVTIQPAGPYCADAAQDTLTGVPAGGTWSGDVTPNGTFDPSLAGPGTFTAIYAYTDPEGCEGTDTISFEVLELPVAAISPAGDICEDAGALTLDAAPAGGTWSGDVDASGGFDPAAAGPGDYQAIYFFENAAGCSDTDTLSFAVDSLPATQIQAASPFCANDTVQMLSASPAGGTWSGAADMQGAIDPPGLGAGNYEAIYAFTTNEGCTAADTLSFEVFALPSAALSGSGDLCQGSADTVFLSLDLTGQPPFTYTLAIDTALQPEAATMSNTVTIPATLPGAYTLAALQDANGCTVAGQDTINVGLNTAPNVSGITTTCDPTNTAYTLSFTISGGDTASYQLEFPDGTVIENVPSSYTSPPIDNGGTYNITVTDANDCNPTVVSGSFSCDCTTQSGTMATTPTAVCEDETATLIYNQDGVLDPDDTLLFVLHDNNGTALGNIIAENDTPTFPFQPGMNYGQTYFVSAVATDVDGSGAPDYSSPCLSVSIGAPVAFYALPSGTVSGDTAICQGQTAALSFTFTGTAPFDFTYEANGQPTLVENVGNTFTLEVMPTTATTYQLTQITDSSPAGCSASATAMANVLVNTPTSFAQTLEICEGDSLFLAGAFQTEAGVYVDTLEAANTCDSILTSTLIVNLPDTTLLTDTSCDPAQVGTTTELLTNENGCDSLVILTTAFLSSDTVVVEQTTCDPAEVGTTETLLTNQEGCDSLVITNTTLLPTDTTFVDATSCDPAEAGTTEALLANQFGCDSLVITTTTLLPSDTTFIDAASCDPAEVGTVEEVLANQFGCDSLVITTTTLLPSDTTFIDAASCDPAEVGTVEEVLANQFGCDSLVITTTTLLPSDTTFIDAASCDPAEVGTVEEVLANQFGCDSLIVTTTTLLPSDTTFIDAASCDPAEVGTVEEVLANQFGCDSLIVTTTTLLPSDTTFIEDTSCDPGQVGTTEELLTNQFGCDSLIVTTTFLLLSDTTYVDLASCDPDEVGTTEALLSNTDGCDSLVITTTTLLPSDTVFVDAASCDPEQTGTTEELFVNQFGCDSLVVTTTELLPSDTTFLDATTCDPAQAGTTEELFVNQFGCDSLVVTTTELLPSDTVFVDATTCDPAEAGTTEVLLVNQFGCDSLVVTNTALLPSDTTQVGLTSCDPAEAGTTEELLTNQFGCDSLVITTTTLLPSDTTFLTEASCDPADVGTVEEILANQFGCDSLVVTTTTLLPSDTTLIMAASCDPADAGTTEEVFINQFGCDSLVVTTTTLLSSDTVTIEATSCQPDDVGTVTEVLTNQNGCDSIVTTITTLAPLEVSAAITSEYGGFSVSCEGGQDGAAAVEITSPGFEPPFTYTWSNGAATPEVEGLPAGAYTVTVSSANGCTAVDSVALTAPPDLRINLNVSPISCFGQTDGAVQVVAEGGAPPYVYAIDDAPFQTEAIFGALLEGSYTVSVQDANGCLASAAILINQPLELEVDLGDDIDISVGESAVLEIATNIEPEDIDTIIWEPRFQTECPECLEQLVTPLVTTAYSVMIEDVNGCTAGDEVNIIVDQRQRVYLPNIFSPNGDNTNDVFFPQGDARVENVDAFQIYNRWGETVFEAYNIPINDPQFGWDGTFRGEQMNSAVFVYHIQVTYQNGMQEQYNGDFTLMR